ncbi:MAG TPA: flagellar hook-associated protein FlgK [Solirubrobacteraceae bacterium]|jgi:flagellar hook-associated protein 1 FlgK|nr:flagellar hook-associated protein FlgK [Solirubrobacteraceae bacterium]
MTIPSFTGLQTALSGLEASQAAIDTTGENIANANTPGYTRQVVRTVESGSLTIPALSQQGAGSNLGTGVSISSISRIRNQFLDVQYRAQNTATSNANTNSSELQQVQTAINEPSTSGLQSVMSKFWSAWSSLATNPTSGAAQQAVIDAGQTLSSTLNSVSSQMSTVQSQAAQQYATLTGTNGQVQQDAGQIATLNAQITQATQAGQTPNSLLDQRDNLVDDLSGLAQISVTDQSDGSVTVNFGDAATPLVNGSTVTWPQTLTSAAGGQLGALLNLSSSTGPIGQLQSSLDNVAGQVISSVNALQPSSPFFSGTSASTIGVSATASTIQASSSSTSGPDLAQSVANLSGAAADQSYSAFVAQVGDGVQAAQNTQTTAQAVLTAVSNQRQSVSGVSLDEEMTNLIQYQQAYQASARVMNAINSTLSTLMSAVGGAGM